MPERFADLMRSGEFTQGFAAAAQGKSAAPARAALSVHLPPPSELQDLSAYAHKTRHGVSGISEREVDKLRKSAPQDQLDLHAHTGEEAREQLEAFLTSALRRKLGIVEIVHGHGTGRLRQLTRYWLSNCPQVLAFCEPPKNSGAVLARLRAAPRPGK